MAKQKKPLWARLLKKLIIFVVTICLIAVGIYCFFRIKYKVDLISVYQDAKQMTKVVDEKTIFPDIFTEDNLPEMKNAINSSIAGYITDDYKISSTVYAYGLEQDLKLNNKNLGQFVDLLIEDKSAQVIQFVGNNIHYNMVQIGFYNYNNETNTVTFNVVLKLDMREVKNNLKQFPLNLLKKIITDDFYLNVNVTVKKESAKFSYTISGGEMLVNSLSSEQSAELLKMFSIFSKMQPLDEQARIIANPILEVLLDGIKDGTLAKFLKEDFDCPDYEFVEENNKTVLVYKKG